MLTPLCMRRALCALLIVCALSSVKTARALPPPDAVSVAGAATVAGLAAAPDARPASDSILHLSFALKSSRLSGLDAFLASQRDPKSPNYRHFLTPRQFGERFGAGDADIAAVTAFARAHGMAVTTVWPGKLFVSADSTVSGVEAAFGVQIRGYRRAEGDTLTGTATFYAPDRAPRLPRDVAGKIDALFGLDNQAVERPSFRRSGVTRSVFEPMVPRVAVKMSAAAPVELISTSERALPVSPETVPGAAPQFSSPMTPAQIGTFYEFDPLHALGFSGQNQTIAVYSPSGFDPGDLAAFASTYGRTGYTLNVINIDGGNTDLSNQTEPALDTEVIVGQARYATINLYQFPNSNSNSLDTYNRIASDNAPVLSISWGSDEHALHAAGQDSLVSSKHAIFSQMASQGIAIYASTGDYGATVSTDGINVTYPASDPNVTAVGGTDNQVDSSSAFVSEQGWSGSGGGRSIYFDTPSYQSGPGVSNSYSNGKRQLPDIATAGGPYPGYNIRAGGVWSSVYGTSAATPLWATANVLINQGTASLGFGSRSSSLNPFLYDIGRNLNGYNHSEVYHDSVDGNNGYPTTAKWDFVTGWGSARFAKLYYDDVYRPDYTPYTPGGWPSPILVSTSSTTVSEPTFFNNLTTYSIGYAFRNASLADGRAETARLTIDGTNYDLGYGDLPASFYFGHLNGHSQTLALGPHTFTVTADVTNGVVESSEGNNSYTRTLTVRPYNDPFTQPLLIGGDSGTSNGVNSYASVESGEPNHGNRAPSASVWWSWTAPSTRTYTFNTTGSSYDTTLGVYQGTAVNALTSVAQNDDANGGHQSSVVFLATAGQVYRIAVDGYNGATGSIQLHWSTSAPANDAFAAAQAIGGASGSVPGSSIGATKESGEPSHGGGNGGGASLWYAWTAPSTGQWTFSTAGSDYDTLLGVYTGSAVNALTTIAGNDDYAGTHQSSVTFLATAGTVYYLAVDGYNGASGNVALAWANSAPTATSLSPTSTPSGGLAFTLYVSGTGFVPTSIVKWNGATRPTTYLSATVLGATVSATDIHTAGSATVAVTTPKVATTGTLTFTIASGGSAAPSITGLSPSSATAGGAAFTLTVNGTNFLSNSVVKWNGSSRTTTYVSATKLTAAIKAADISASGDVPVTVTTPMVGTSGAVSFTVKASASPTLTSLSPTTRAAGATAFTLTVNGTSFASNSVVKWNGSSRTTTYVSTTKLTATIPASDLVNAGAFPVTVTTPSVGTSNSLAFSVQALTLSVGSMTRGAPGVTVPVTLTNTTPISLPGVTVTTAQLGGKNPTSSLPVSLGTMASGTSKTTTFVFPGSAGASGATVNLLISGSYSGGTFSISKSVVLP